MRLRLPAVAGTLFRNGATLSLLLSAACALFSPYGKYFFANHYFSSALFLSRIQSQASSSQELAASLSSLCPLFCAPSVCFQSFAASFPKMPGVGASRMPLRDTRGGGQHDPLSTFNWGLSTGF